MKVHENFCLYPFTHIATKTDGSLKLCCRSEAVNNIKDVGIEEHWNSQGLRDIRKQFFRGEKPKECDACWRNEAVGTRSMRQRSMKSTNPESRWNLYSRVLEEFDPETGQLNSLPKTMEIKTTNICNLKCRMCHPVDSSSWAKDWSGIAHLMKTHNKWAYEKVQQYNLIKKPILNQFERSAWFSQIEGLSSNLDTIEFAGGEPLLDPGHYALLEKLAPTGKGISLKYSTNLTSLSLKSQSVLELWKSFKKVHLYISMDGTGKIYDYIRSNGKFEDILKNLRQVRHEGINIGDVAIACTVQIYNVFNIVDVAEFCLENDLKFHLHYVSYPQFLNVQILPQKIKNDVIQGVESYLESLNSRPVAPEVLRHISDHLRDFLNYLRGSRDENLLSEFLEYTDTLDQMRLTSFEEIHLKAAEYLKEVRIQDKLRKSSPPAFDLRST